MIVERYDIKKDVNKVLKSEWKKEVKEKIQMKVEEDLRKQCEVMTKTRTVKNDLYETKAYLHETSLYEARDILLTRLHNDKNNMQLQKQTK